MEKDNFKSLLTKSNQLKSLNLDFTEQVMTKVEHPLVHKTKFKPLISKKVGWIIVACYLAILSLPFLIGSAEAASLLVEQVSLIGLDIKQLRQNSILVSLILIVFTSFAYADSLYMNKRLVA